MKSFKIVYLLLLACCINVYGQSENQSQKEIQKMDTSFTKQTIELAKINVDIIVHKVEISVKNKNEPFRLIVRLKAKAGYLEKVLASYKGQQELAAKNSGSVIYHVSLDTNDGGIVLYEAWKDFSSFEKHERHNITLKHFARTTDWLEKERSVQIVIDASHLAPVSTYK